MAADVACDLTLRSRAAYLLSRGRGVLGGRSAAAPVLQHPVGPYRLDLAYPGIRLAVEYGGRDHLMQERALRDLDRQAYLSRAG